ncbi:glycosyltransferase [Aliamphritea spongicola]|nr:glycosyltransferase [Aliamphritea spongicola]
MGDGDEYYKQVLVDSGVEVLGWKSKDEVKDLLEKSKIYLSTSLWEGLPVSPIESMIAGAVPVLSDCSGNKDLISNGINGFTFEAAQKAVDHIVRLIDNEELFNSISFEAEGTSKNRYSIERYQNQITDIMGV